MYTIFRLVICNGTCVLIQVWSRFHVNEREKKYKILPTKVKSSNLQLAP